MSRIGKKPIKFGNDVQVTVSGDSVNVVGPKGKLDCSIPSGVSVEAADGTVNVAVSGQDKNLGAMQGLCRSLINNMIVGVSQGFKKELEIQGVGFRGTCQGRKLNLNLGFSHPIEFEVPEGVDVTMPENTKIVLEGCDRQLVGQTAATIRAFRKPDAYKGKGVRYVGEYISLKEGKTV